MTAWTVVELSPFQTYQVIDLSQQVRNLLDSAGNSIQEAGPSMAVQIVGLDSVPVAGDEFNVMPTEQEVSPPPPFPSLGPLQQGTMQSL